MISRVLLIVIGHSLEDFLFQEKTRITRLLRAGKDDALSSTEKFRSRPCQKVPHSAQYVQIGYAITSRSVRHISTGPQN